MLKTVRRWCVLTVAGVVVAACGGATDSGLFDSPASGSGSSSSSSSGGMSIDAGGGSKTDAGGGKSTDAGGVVSTGKDAAAPVVDASPPPSTVTITCQGGPACNAATSICCVSTDQQGGTESTCTQPSGCAGQNQLAVACDSAAACAAQGSPAGDVCCVTEDPQTGLAMTVACVDPTNCAQDTQAVMCDDGSACPTGDTCVTSSTTIPGYKICRK